MRSESTFAAAPPPLQEELTRQAEERCCPVCMDRRKDLAFGCGHLVCHECSAALDRCPVCRQPVASRIRLYG